MLTLRRRSRVLYRDDHSSWWLWDAAPAGTLVGRNRCMFM